MLIVVFLLLFTAGGVTIGTIHNQIEEPRTVTVKESRTELNKQRSWLTNKEYFKRLNKTDL